MFGWPYTSIRNIAKKCGFRRYHVNDYYMIYVNQNRVVVLIDARGVQISKDGELIEEVNFSELNEPLSVALDSIFMRASTY